MTEISLGSSLEDFLKTEGINDEVTLAALKKVLEWLTVNISEELVSIKTTMGVHSCLLVTHDGKLHSLLTELDELKASNAKLQAQVTSSILNKSLTDLRGNVDSVVEVLTTASTVDYENPGETK